MSGFAAARDLARPRHDPCETPTELLDGVAGPAKLDLPVLGFTTRSSEIDSDRVRHLARGRPPRAEGEWRVLRGAGPFSPVVYTDHCGGLTCFRRGTGPGEWSDDAP